MFTDSESLRERLRALVDANGRSQAGTPGKVAFVYAGHGSGWDGRASALYANEPVVRAVLDRCEEVFGEVRGASLLDVMFGRSGAAGDPGDPQWQRPAVYALECALTALWTSVGVSPGVALGHRVGALAAAQAAGVLGLEDGLRLAAAPGAPGALPGVVAMGTPSLTLVDAVSGRVVAPDEVPDAAQWLQRAATGPEVLENCVATLAAAGVDVVVEVGPHAESGSSLAAVWPDAAGSAAVPVVLSSLGRPSDGDEAPTAGSDGGFIEAVAGTYEAGLALSFPGLFAGEYRRRIALPDYPFERRRHWIRMRK